MLDEQLRRRLRTAADVAPNELDRAARERIVAAVVSQGPREMQRARVVRLASRTGVAFAAAAGVTLAVGLATLHEQGSDRRVAAVSPPTATPMGISACAEQARPYDARFVAKGDKLVLDLGAVAFAAADADSTLSVAEAEPCHVVIALSSGRVVVETRELGGGKLTIRSKSGDVVVTGATVAVTQRDSELIVEVVKGSAVVHGPDFVGREVLAKRRLQLNLGALTESLLPTSEIAGIERALGKK
jgi:hypothetical protein